MKGFVGVGMEWEGGKEGRERGCFWVAGKGGSVKVIEVMMHC